MLVLVTNVTFEVVCGVDTARVLRLNDTFKTVLYELNKDETLVNQHCFYFKDRKFDLSYSANLRFLQVPYSNVGHSRLRLRVNLCVRR